MCILDISFGIDLSDHDNRYIYPIAVDIWTFAENNETRLNVGSARCFYLDNERSMNDNEASPDSFLDVHSGSADFMSHIYCPDSYEFTEIIQTLFPDALINYNLLIIDRLEILPAYRGNALSTRIIKELIHRLGKGAGVVALKPFPLQFENSESDRKPNARYSQLELQNFTGSEIACTKKLTKLYEHTGFSKLGDTGLMVMCTTAN